MSTTSGLVPLMPMMTLVFVTAGYGETLDERVAADHEPVARVRGSRRVRPDPPIRVDAVEVIVGSMTTGNTRAGSCSQPRFGVTATCHPASVCDSVYGTESPYAGRTRPSPP